MSERTQRFATRNNALIRGAFIAALITLLLGIADWVGEAWFMEYGLDLPMMWIVTGAFALLSGSGFFLGSSARVEIGRDYFRVSDGYDLLSGRQKVIPLANIHTVTLTVATTRKRSLFHLKPKIEDSLMLRYRWPERKMMAVEYHLPLHGFDNAAELIAALVRLTEPQWRLYTGGSGNGEIVEGSQIVEVAERVFERENRLLPMRNERGAQEVQENNTGNPGELLSPE